MVDQTKTVTILRDIIADFLLIARIVDCLNMIQLSKV